MEFYNRKQKGFTLLETMLVLGIMGGMMIMAINYGTRQVAQQRRDKVAMQAQQILNAGLAYYIAYGSWPVAACNFNSGTSTSTGTSPLTLLTGSGFLPQSMSGNNSFGNPFMIDCDSVTGGVFYVVTQLNNKANALIVAGELPVAYLSGANGTPATNGPYVTAQVTTPGQNLNNARSVNFVGVYHHGACVPVPNCPGYNPAGNPPGCTGGGTNCMVPQIMVAPASVSGVNDPGSNNAYPITSFTAYALGPSATPDSCPAVIAPAITPSQAPSACVFGPNGIPSAGGANAVYWRVCLQVVTGKGIVSTTNTTPVSPSLSNPNPAVTPNAWGEYATMVVMTRCTPPNEPFGSDFTVFTQ